MREKLIELIGKAKYDVDRICVERDWCDGCPAAYGEGNCKEAYIADHLIANGVTIQKWIPASEPPKSKINKVVVRCKNGYVGFGHYSDYKGRTEWFNLESGMLFTDWNDWRSDEDDSESYEVTHWMPLPEPPKGE